MIDNRGARVEATWAALPVELVVGCIFFGHGLQKLMDPSGFGTNMLGHIGFPFFMTYVVIAAEFGGGLLLLAGFLVRLGALGHLCVMTVAITFVHWPNGLLARGGFELPLALLAASLGLLVLGADPLSIDRNVKISASRPGPTEGPGAGVTITDLRVKVAGVLLILAGIAIVAARGFLGVPEGNPALAAVVVAGVTSVASGVAIALEQQRGFGPAFVMARLYLGASALLLFWVKYTVRGFIAVAVSLVILSSLRAARRGRDL